MAFDLKKYRQDWYLKNRVRILKNQRVYYLKNRNRILLRIQEYSLKNREQILAQHRLYYQKNSGHFREYRITNRINRSRYALLRYRTDPVTKLVVQSRNRINAALRGVLKTSSSFQLIGCTPLELWTYLESKFVPGMTRENYGPVWHVDHIKPCASFDLTNLAQQKECFHYSNLQPLFAIDNLRKGNRDV